MPFVKLDCGILNSTLWFEREAREVFITALLMAEPYELREPAPEIEVTSLKNTAWAVPPGWYGFVPAAGVGIIHRAGVEDAAGIAALKMLASPEKSSRSRDFDGRRMVRIDGGYLILNYMKYRDRDYTAAERQRRFRARKKDKASRRNVSMSRRNITQAEAEAEAEAEADRLNPSARFARFWSVYPKKIGKGGASKAFERLKPSEELLGTMLDALEVVARSEQWKRDGGRYIPNPATWLNQRRWEDEPTVKRPDPGDWWDECKRLHNGTCENSRLHRHRLDMDAEKGQP